MARIFIPLAVLLLSLTTAGCGSSPPKVDLRSLRIVSLPDANDDSATAVDVVFVMDSAAVPGLPADCLQWFSQRPRWVDGDPGRLKVVSLQLPPGKDVQVTLPPGYEDAVEARIYANYIEKDGQYPVPLSQLKQPLVVLKSGSIAVGDAKTMPIPGGAP
jgi:type VI secretion system protein